MKIIIYDGNPTKISTEKYAMVQTSAGLLRLIQDHQDEDIEGDIWPCAKNNPEFHQILKIIYEHKRKLWDKHGRVVIVNDTTYSVHQYFSEVLEQNNIFM